MSKCRSIVYNLLIFCISVICQRRLKGEVSFRGKFLSHLRDENELRVLPGRRLPAHIRFIIHTIRTRYAFIGPVTNAAQEKADFSTKKPPKEIILHCAHHSPADQIFIDQFHNLLDALRTFPFPLVSVHSRGGLYYSDQCTQSDAAFNISHRIIQAAKR